MSDIGKQALKTKINSKVYENSSQAITGAAMNEVLQDMVDTLCDGANLDAGSVTDSRLQNPVSVSQNSQTGHTDINIGDSVNPVASVADVRELQAKNGLNFGLGQFTTSDVVFTKDDITIGENIIISFSLVGSYGALGFFKSDDTQLAEIGTGIAGVTDYAKTIPENFAYAKPVYGSIIVTSLIREEIMENRILKEYVDASFYDKTYLRLPFNSKVQMIKVATTFTSGIFDLPNEGYHTSDYIALDAWTEKNYYISFDDNLPSSYTMARFYDANYKEVGRVYGTGYAGEIKVHKRYLITPPRNAKYIKYVDDLTNSDNSGVFYAPASELDEFTGLSFYKDTFLRSPFNSFAQMSKIDTTFTSGIFDIPNAGYHTSDYIELKNWAEKNYYISFDDNLPSSYTMVRFYDKNQTEIGRVWGTGYAGSIAIHKKYMLCPPNGTKYVRYVDDLTNSDNSGVFEADAKPLEDTIKEVAQTGESPLGKVLWVGTSIPAGCTYPAKSCQNLGTTCINKAIGASFVMFDSTPVTSAGPYDGLALSASVQELETKFRGAVTSGSITEAKLDEFKQASYENVILPYLDEVKTIVLDHGYNDGYNLQAVVAAGEDAVDWTSTDRTTFIGAMNYVIRQIWQRKPFMKIIIGGYFQNQFNADAHNGEYVCEVLTWIARHYNLPLLDTWNYAGMGTEYVPNSSSYISDFNATYGTSYTPQYTDQNGNIMRFQLYCPDFVHPWTDLTGNSNKILDRIFTKLLRDLL